MKNLILDYYDVLRSEILFVSIVLIVKKTQFYYIVQGFKHFFKARPVTVKNIVNICYHNIFSFVKSTL